MPIYLFDSKRGAKCVVEVGPSADGTETYLAVDGGGVWIPPEWARKVAASLIEYAEREERGAPLTTPEPRVPQCAATIR